MRFPLRSGRSGPPAPRTPPDDTPKIPDDLSEELELIAMEATRGEPLSPTMLRRIERDVTALFYRRGQEGVRVIAEVEGAGIRVTLLFPRAGARVRQVSLRLG